MRGKKGKKKALLMKIRQARRGKVRERHTIGHIHTLIHFHSFSIEHRKTNR
jgi:hypothetical protein